MRNNFELMVRFAALIASTLILIRSLFFSIRKRTIPPRLIKFVTGHNLSRNGMLSLAFTFYLIEIRY